MRFMEGVRQMASERSIKAWFRGNGANCLKVGPETALKLTINDEMKNYLESLPWTGTKKGEGKSSLTFWQRVMLGGFSGGVGGSIHYSRPVAALTRTWDPTLPIPTRLIPLPTPLPFAAQTVVFPLEVARTRLAVAPQGTYTGLSEQRGSLRHALAHRGYSCCCRLCSCCFLPPLLPSRKQQLVRAPQSQLLGDAWHLELQKAPNLHEPSPCESSLCPLCFPAPGDCFKQMLAREGYPSLYRGMVPSLIGILPYAGTDIATFSMIKARVQQGLRASDDTGLDAGLMPGDAASSESFSRLLLLSRH